MSWRCHLLDLPANLLAPADHAGAQTFGITDVSGGALYVLACALMLPKDQLRGVDQVGVRLGACARVREDVAHELAPAGQLSTRPAQASGLMLLSTSNIDNVLVLALPQVELHVLRDLDLLAEILTDEDAAAVRPIWV
ncbi:hypothetical protein AURDEDRAFT_171118 [Auricularia subglabra TFB-10046 SS5]|nr:hypothetical protein AURDEDRAFT_171118 [Auricularia subglabra TFB-10046 SS5]